MYTCWWFGVTDDWLTVTRYLHHFWRGGGYCFYHLSVQDNFLSDMHIFIKTETDAELKKTEGKRLKVREIYSSFKNLVDGTSNKGDDNLWEWWIELSECWQHMDEVQMARIEWRDII